MDSDLTFLKTLSQKPQAIGIGRLIELVNFDFTCRFSINQEMQISFQTFISSSFDRTVFKDSLKCGLSEFFPVFFRLKSIISGQGSNKGSLCDLENRFHGHTS